MGDEDDGLDYDDQAYSKGGISLGDEPKAETVENLDIVLCGQALGLLRHLEESIRWLISVLLSKPPRKEIVCRVRLSDLLRAGSLGRGHVPQVALLR